MDNEKKSSIYMYVKKKNKQQQGINKKKYLIDGTQVNLIFFFLRV